jgi:hypothetical protein
VADDPKKPGSEFDRMSLGSLQRELEMQKAKSEAAREEAKARMAEEAAKQKAFPWGTLAAVLGGGILLFFGLVYALRASFPGVAAAALPDWVYTPYDGGPPPARPDAGPPVVASPPDAGVHHTGGHGGGHGGHGGSSGSSSSSGGLDLDGLGGDTTDPVEGL